MKLFVADTERPLLMHGLRRTHLDNAAREGRGVIDEYSSEVWLVDWKRHGLPRCSVYLITPDSEWPCKVGISTYARKRLLGLQTAVWRPLKVARCVWANTVADARALEKKMHDSLTEMGVWLHGEWFDMKPEKAIELMEFNAMMLGIEISDQIDSDEALQTVRRQMDVYNSPAKVRQRRDEMGIATRGY